MNTLRSICFFCLFLLLTVEAEAQAPFRMEIDIPGELVQSSTHQATYDGGAVVLICTYNNIIQQSYVTVIKQDTAGNMQWQRRFTGTSISSASVIQAADSGYFVCFCDYTSFSDGSYQVIRLDAAGTSVYSRNVEAVAPYQVNTTPQVLPKANGSCYVIGDVVNTTTLQYFIHVFELDAGGNILWSHVYNAYSPKSYHMNADTCSNGDLVILGRHFDQLTQTHCPMILRISSTGVFVWRKFYNTANITLHPRSLVVLPGDRIEVVSILYNNLVSISETMLMRCDGAGNVYWTFRFSNPTHEVNMMAIANAGNNSTVMAGSSTYGGLFIKNDTTGLLLCQRFYYDVKFTAIDTITGGNYSMSGLTAPNGRCVYMTAGSCGSSCMDSLYTIIKTPMSTVASTLSGDALLSLVDTTMLPSASPATIHFQEVCNTTGIGEEPVKEIDVYPNPCAGNLYLRDIGNFETIQLYDVNGKIVLSRNVTGAAMEIDVSALPAGIYILRLQSNARTAVHTVAVTNQY